MEVCHKSATGTGQEGSQEERGWRKEFGTVILEKVMGECLEEERPWESKEVDGRILFGGMP